jgi:hypothetical protein
MRCRSALPAVLLLAGACGGSASDGTTATSGPSGSADGSTTSPTSLAETTASTSTGGEDADATSTSSSSGADASTGVADQTSSTSTDTTAVDDASSSDSGVAPWCVDHCACMATTCAAYEGYPWSGAGDCESECSTWGDAEADCFPMWCSMAARAGASAAHLCEHAWNAFGLDEC